MNTKENDITSYISSRVEEVVEKTMSDIFSSPSEGAPTTLPYSTIAEYTAQTGKRYRKTKDQTSRGLDREAAFAEFLVEQQKKN